MITRETLLQAFDGLREDMKKRWNRFVPVGELLEDRWTRAAAMGFGEGSNIYDSAAVIGDVTVGKNCWIGPNAHLDGSGGLTIGNHATIGICTVIFSHNTAERDLSGGAYPAQYQPTSIGNHVFTGPHCVIEMGANIGDYCVIMSHSVVKWPTPSHSILHGNPARIIGKVVLEEGRKPSMRFTRDGMEVMKSARATYADEPSHEKS